MLLLSNFPFAMIMLCIVSQFTDEAHVGVQLVYYLLPSVRVCVCMGNNKSSGIHVIIYVQFISQLLLYIVHVVFGSCLG